MKRHIPNSLTILRFILIPFFIYYAFFSNSDKAIIWATLIFIVASITDYLDGLLARKLDAISNFGKIMDPLADKILVLSALLALTLKLDTIPLWLLITIFVRELIVSFFRELFASKKIFIAANLWGKVKTFMQMIGVIAALLYKCITAMQISPEMLIIDQIFLVYFIFVTAITWISGFQYLFVILAMRKK